MMVNSPISIYSVVIGAQLYNDIFNILVSFGVIYIPLIVLFFQAIKAYFECPHGGGTTLSINSILLGLAMYILVIFLTVIPTKSLKVNSIGYTPSCSQGAVRSTYGNTGTTFDTVFKKYEYDNIKLPLLMMFALESSSGFTNLAITMLPCKTDVDKIQGIINTTNLPRDMVDEVKRFHNECYARAITRFDSQKPAELKDKPNKTDYDRLIYNKYQDNFKKYGGYSDLSWIGSHILQEIYYPHIYAMEPTKPFPYRLFTDYTLETDMKNRDKERPTYGYPSCSEWWSDRSYGLQARLVKLAEDNTPQNARLGRYNLIKEVKTWKQEVAELFSQNTGEQQDLSSAEDIIAKSILSKGVNGGFGKDYQSWVSNDLGGNEYTSTAAPVIDLVTTAVGQFGQGKDAAYATVKRYEMTQEMPIAQSVLFVLFMALGPIILLLGRFQVGVIASYYFILCSSIFLPFLIKMLNFVEKSLHESMGYGLYSTEQYLIMYNWFTQFYFYIPIAYIVAISISGVQVGSAVSGLMGNSVSSGGAGVMAKGFRGGKR